MDISGPQSPAVAATESAWTWLRTTLVAVQIEATRWHGLNVLRRWIDRVQRVRVSALLRRETQQGGVVSSQQQVTLRIGDTSVDVVAAFNGSDGEQLAKELLRQVRRAFAAELVAGPGTRN